MPDDLVVGSIEHDLGLELPPSSQVLLQQVHVVQVPWCAELFSASGD
jgi:hypothetical protein